MNTSTRDNSTSQRRRLGVKDLVTIGICGVLAMVINTVIGMILTPIYGFAYPLVGGLCALFSAPVYVLMSYRVAKRGTAVLFYLIIAIISALPGFFYMIPFSLAAGLICEAILWRPGAYRNSMLNAVTYMIFGIMFSIGSYLPIYLFGDTYYDQFESMGASAELFLRFATSPGAVAVSVIAGAVLALLGHWMGRRLLSKHFVKAGIITAA